MTAAPFIEDDYLSRHLDTWILGRKTPRERTEIRVYASAIGDLLEVREAKKGRSQPSGCQRKLYLDFFPEQSPPIPNSADSEMNMELGNRFHDLIAYALDQRGILVRQEYPLKQFTSDTSGRFDWLIMHPERGLCIADGKSQSDWAFDHLEGPKPADVAQVTHYLDVLGLDWGCLLYYKKSSGKRKEYWFRKSPEVVTAIREAAEAFTRKVAQDKLANRFDPPPMPEGVTARNWPCAWGKEGATCRHFNFCHGETETPEPKIRLGLKGGD